MQHAFLLVFVTSVAACGAAPDEPPIEPTGLGDDGSDPGAGDVDGSGGDTASGDADGDGRGDASGGDANEPGDGDSSGGDSGGGDAGGDGGGDTSGGDVDPEPLPRGLAWVKSNPMFVSGLTVAMGAPPAAFVHDYYDGFNATATHLWANGLPTEVQGWHDAGRADFRYVAWTDPDGASVNGTGLMGGMSAPLPGRIGYQVGDEPGIGCDGASDNQCAMNAMRAMAAGVAALRARDAGALIFCNFAAVRFVDDVLAYYASEVDADVVSYDSYDAGRSHYTALERFRAAGLSSRRPYWRYMRGFIYDNDAGAVPTEADMRWDAFSGALYGYTGHTWFLYTISSNPDIGPVFFSAESDFAAATTETWHRAAQINTELSNLGHALTQLTSTDVRYQAALSFRAPEGTRPWSRGAGGDPYLTSVAAKDNALQDVSVGFFRDDRGEIYVMAQNVSHDAGEYPVSWTGAAVLRFTFDFAGAPANVSRARVLALDKVNARVAPLPFTSTSGATATLEVALPAGEIVFWKYDTGVAFAWR